MPDIVHRIGIKSTPDKIYEALTTQEGLCGWWTEHTTAEPQMGARLEFRFPNTGPVMEVIELAQNENVKWKCVDCVEEWVDTILEFGINRDEKKDLTFVTFSHRGWGEENSMFAHCNMKWAVFLLSLKEYCETGKGRAFPNDIKVDDKM